MHTTVKVPPNGEAHVILEGVDEVVKSGEYSFVTEYSDDPKWPPQVIQGLQGNEVEAFYVE